MLSGKESACNAGDIGDMGLIPGLGRDPWVGKSSLEKEMATTPDNDLGLFGGEEVRLGQGFPFLHAGASMAWTSYSCRKRLSQPIQAFLTCLVVGQKGQS